MGDKGKEKDVNSDVESQDDNNGGEAKPKNLNFRCTRHKGSMYHDIFISYRVATDKKIADKLALTLDGYRKKHGGAVRTFLDANCLTEGGDWEENFLWALHHSSLVVLLISEAGMDLKSSSPGLTKIQYADHEQDNCLLEYELALELAKQGGAKLFVLCVGKEVYLDKTRCISKFLSNYNELTERRKMYEATGPHNHKKGAKGPPVSETMGELLAKIRFDDPDQDDFSYLDPDDVYARVPDILHKLDAVQSKLPIKERLHRFYKDISFIETKIFGMVLGFVFGIFLFGIDLICTLNQSSPRQTALSFGILVGCGLQFFGGSLIAFIYAGLQAQKYCNGFFVCVRHIDELYYLIPDYYQSCYNGYNGTCAEMDFIDVPVNGNCVNCFCNNWSSFCDYLSGNKSAYLFIGMLGLIVSVAFFAFAARESSRSNKKKADV